MNWNERKGTVRISTVLNDLFLNSFLLNNLNTSDAAAGIHCGLVPKSKRHGRIVYFDRKAE